MLLYNNYSKHLPTAEELPCSDEQPVDSEQQELVGLLLREILIRIWSNRQDWFFGLDMGWYYHPEKPAIVPDSFLSLGVERLKESGPRLSYVQWEEKDITPILTVEVVSKTAGGEFTQKKALYERLGVLYYVIIAPRRRRKPKLTIYRLEEGKYQLKEANPLWVPELGLGIGMEWGIFHGIADNWLYWYDEKGCRYLTESEVRLATEERAEKLAQRLRELGIDPEQI